MAKKLVKKYDAIVMTISQGFLKDYGLAQFKHVLNHLETAGLMWNQTISAFPTQHIEWVYFCWKGRVRCRLTVVKFEEGTKEFIDRLPNGGIITRTHRNKKWVLLCAPVVWADRKIKMVGFQGFRYTEFLF